MDECHNYGIMAGCDERCPALLKGECQNIIDAIECCDLRDEEREEILKLYRSFFPPFRHAVAIWF